MMVVIRRVDTGLYLQAKHYWDVRWVQLEEARVYRDRATAGRSKGALLNKSFEYRNTPFDIEFVGVELKIMGVIS